MVSVERSTHWDSYYKGKEVPIIPSQFAVFALGEYTPSTILDVGCGSGRDTFFFASQGIATIGIDGSASAVELCKSRVNGHPLRFIQMDVKDADFAKKVASTLNGAGDLMIYARFFLHAVTDEEECAFLQSASALLERYGGVLALEFRTTRDRSLNKVTPDHYRRFVDPAILLGRAAEFRLESLYSTEGFGMAKYKEDDAYVSRLILRQKRSA